MSPAASLLLGAVLLAMVAGVEARGKNPYIELVNEHPPASPTKNDEPPLAPSHKSEETRSKETDSDAAGASENAGVVPMLVAALVTGVMGGAGAAALLVRPRHSRESTGESVGASVAATEVDSKCPFGFSAADATLTVPTATPAPAGGLGGGEDSAEVTHRADSSSKCPVLGALLNIGGSGSDGPVLNSGLRPGLTPDGHTRTILLTGASRGIGHGTAKMFAAAGWRVITCSRTAFPRGSPRRGVSSKCPWAGGTVNHVTVDLSDPEDIRLAINDIKRKLAGQPLHALVNNAAISPKMKNSDGSSTGKRMGVADTSLEDWQEVFQVNFHAPVMLVNGLLNELLAAVPSGGGSVVNVTSIVGSRVHPFAGPAYATSKAALSALTREMAAEFGTQGLRVNAISPGEIDTSILSPGTEDIVENEIPMRRLGTVSEVAHAIYFLVSEQSAYVNGTELHINGGQHC